MKEPRFWSNPPENTPFWVKLLSPLSVLYSHGTAKAVARDGYKSKRPVICIGNINAGGTGKTPTVIAILQHLQARGYSPHVVSRGYGGKLDGPVLVDPNTHTAADTGDEPLLISAFAPVHVSKQRAEGVKRAEQQGADVIVLDDGFQNGSVKHDLDIIVVDAHRGFGNGRVIPAGPLREPINVGQLRGDILLSIGTNPTQNRFSAQWGDSVFIPRTTAELQVLQTGMDWESLPVMAFAGIAHPDKFFETLSGLGANLLRAEALADHQPLSIQLMKRLEIEAMALGAQLVTTEKDAVRLPASFRQKVITLPVRLSITDWSEIDRELDRIGLG